ncbi:hypothetical protein B0G80_2070 [Paraburkholderia sp. BL6669N2]|nr:hypothetical protein B0G80_2070 [Paraburkholderia sp. BL6669N2]
MYGIETLLSALAPTDYAEQSMQALLQAFGVDAGEARKLAYAEIAECRAPQGPVFDKVGAVLGKTTNRRQTRPFRR